MSRLVWPDPVAKLRCCWKLLTVSKHCWHHTLAWLSCHVPWAPVAPESVCFSEKNPSPKFPVLVLGPWSAESHVVSFRSDTHMQTYAHCYLWSWGVLENIQNNHTASCEFAQLRWDNTLDSLRDCFPVAGRARQPPFSFYIGLQCAELGCRLSRDSLMAERW